MIKIIADGEKVIIELLDSNVEDGIADSLNLIVSLLETLAEALEIKDTTALAESIFKAVKELLKNKKGEKNETNIWKIR